MGLGSIAKSVGKVVSSAKSMWDDSGLGTIVDAVQPFIQGGMTYAGQQSINAANAAEAEKNRQFQMQMRATQYQTAVQDMIKAGLNPMLAYQQGGAGNLSGSVAAPYQNALGQGVSSALAARQNIAQVRNLEVQNKNLAEQTRLIPAQVAQAQASTDYLNKQSATEVARAARELQAIKIDKARLDLDRALGASLAALQHAQSRANDANSAETVQRTVRDAITNEQDATARKSLIGKIARRTGTVFKDFGQILNFFK